MTDYANTLLDAVSVVIDKKLEQLEYNKTVKAIIIDNSKASKGVYTVKLGSATFDAYSENKSYAIDDVVQVSIPNNDTSGQKIIIGKVIAANDDGYVSTKPFDSFINISDNLIIDELEAGLIANHLSDLKQEVLLWSESYYNNPLNGYTEIGVQAKFRSWLSSYDIATGNYGLRLDIHTRDKKEQVKIYHLYFSNKNMIGNPYNFATFINQQIVFDISNISNIIYMELVFYQEGGTFFDVDGDMIPYEEQITDSLTVDLPKNLFVKDVLLAFGFNSKELIPGEDYVKLYSNDTVNYTENEIKNIKLHWIHWFSEESNTVMDSSSTLSYEIRWYQYELNGGNTEDSYMNQNWKLLEDQTNKYEIAFITSARNQVEQLQTVIIVDSDELGKQVLYSNIIQFENLYQVTAPVLQDSGLVLTCLDESEGNYFIYGPGNTLLQPSDANVTRSIKVDFRQGNNSNINIFNDSTVTYNIEWKYDTNNSMFEVIGNPQNMRTLNYKIKDYYSSWQTNNTIICTVTTQENDYSISTSIDLLFGTGGTSGTDATLVLGFAENTINGVPQNAIAAGATTAKFRARLYNSSNKIISPQEYNITWNIEGGNNVELEPGNNSTVEITSSGFNMTDRLVLVGTINNYGDYPLVAKFPIPITANIYKYNQLRGVTQVIYSTLGYPVAYNTPYELENAPSVNEPIEDITWRIVYYNNEGNVINYIPAGLDITPPIGVATISANNILQPYVMYVKDCYAYSVQAVNSTASEIIYWNQPILTIQNAYPSATLNSWNGQDVIVDSEDGGGSITAPAIAAGKKNNDNTFSGIMMGDWSSQNTDESISSLTGLYGFQSGIMSYAFKEDGTAFVGKSGVGRINFDGNHGWITSGDFELSDDETIINPQTGALLRYYTGTSFLDLSSQGQYIQVYSREASQYQLQHLVVKFGNNFFINSSGDVYITGDLTATRLIAVQAGRIGAFNIDLNWLYSISEDQKESVYLGTDGIFLGLDFTQSNSSSLLNSPFYVTKSGSIKATKGSIGGWSIRSAGLYYITNPSVTRSNAVFINHDNFTFGVYNSQTNTIANSDINVQISHSGGVYAKILNTTQQLQVSGKVNGVYAIAQLQLSCTFPKGTGGKTISGKAPLANYYAVGMMFLQTNHATVLKVGGFGVNTDGSYYIRLIKTSKTKSKMVTTIKFRILYIKQWISSSFLTPSTIVLPENDADNDDEVTNFNKSEAPTSNLALNETGGGGIDMGSLDPDDYSSAVDVPVSTGITIVTPGSGGNADVVTTAQIEEIVGPNWAAQQTKPNLMSLQSDIADINLWKNGTGNSGLGRVLSAYAKLDSPAFEGTPTAPTATTNTNNTQIATTAFVHNVVEALSPTNTQLKNKINAIIRAANLDVNEFD